MEEVNLVVFAPSSTNIGGKVKEALHDCIIVVTVSYAPGWNKVKTSQELNQWKLVVLEVLVM